MIVYLVHVRKYTIKRNEANKRFFPVHAPDENSQILVQISEKFPAAFEYWNIKPDDFLNKTKVLGFKSIKKMFDYFLENNFDTGTTLASFYKTKKEVPNETPLDGTLIYTYKNLSIHALRIS